MPDIEALQMLPAENENATGGLDIWSTDVCTVFLSCYASCPSV
jgi:hypothetical protein